MTTIPSFIFALREKALHLQMWLAALLLLKDYRKDASIREFNALDTDDFANDLWAA